jgi:hypothetical protein
MKPLVLPGEEWTFVNDREGKPRLFYTPKESAWQSTRHAIGALLVAVVGIVLLLVAMLYLGVCFLFVGPLIGLSALITLARAPVPR